jgi:hypothetical protein
MSKEQILIEKCIVKKIKLATQNKQRIAQLNGAYLL